MRQINIDGTKNDIRVLCTGASESADAGYVDGVPIDPPDDSPGWVLVDLWVEHDTEQETQKAEKGERGKLTTRLVNPAYYQLWVRPKPAQKKRRKAKTLKADPIVTPAIPSAATEQEPKKKRGRKHRNQQEKKNAAGSSPNGEGGEAQEVSEVTETT
jgi:hypothetical protein